MTRAQFVGKWAVALALAVFMTGCNNDGATGPTGGTGPQGPTGPSGPPGPTQPFNTLIGLAQDMPGVRLVITGLSGASGAAFQPGDTMSVTFTVKTNNGTPIPLNELDSARMWMGGPTTLYQKVTGDFNNIATGSVQNPDGSFTYSFTIPTTYPLQYNEEGNFPESEGLSGQALLSGTYTICFRAYKNYWDTNGTRFRDVGNVVKDFLVGAATVLQPRTVVTDAACNACHGTLQMHGGGYRTVKMCITCHTTGAEADLDAEETPNNQMLDFRVLIHKLHNAPHLPSANGVTVDGTGKKVYGGPAAHVPYMIGGINFSEEVHFPVFPTGMPRDVGYDAIPTADYPGESFSPQDEEDEILDGVYSCAKCHVDPDGSGPLTLADNAAYTTPSRRACGACHDDIKWNQTYISNSAVGMPSQADDSSCSGCHPGSSAGNALAIMDAHRHPIHDSALDPGANIKITAVAEGAGGNGDGTIDVGEKIQVTLNIKNDAGADIPPASIDRWEILVGGPSENPQMFQRLYIPRDMLGAVASSYTVTVPEFWTLNYVGNYAASGTFPAATIRAPFYTTANTNWSPDIEVYEITAVGASTTLTAAAVPGQNYLDVANGAIFALDNFIVVDPGPNAQYYRVNTPSSSTPNRVRFGALSTGANSADFTATNLKYAPWVRTALPVGTTVAVVTAVKKTITTHYTVNTTTGQITTSASGWTAGTPILISAVTDFVMPSTYRQGNSSFNVTDGSLGAWIGLPVLSGTYGVMAGVGQSFSVVPPRALGTGVDDTSYTEPSTVSSFPFLVGSATSLDTYPPILLSDPKNCDACHAVPGQRMVFHGRRAGAEYCYACHGTAQFGSGSPVQGRRFMRYMIHGYHMGSDLTFASIYEGGAAAEIGFPMFPGGVKHCDKCHGNTSYTEPIGRDHPNQVVPTKTWAASCLPCHDSNGAKAHADLNTAPSGYESCAACHDPGSIYNVALVHKNR